MPERAVNAGRTDRLVYRQALSDYDNAPPVLVAAGTDRTSPSVTIGIPTFRRPALLVESVRSAMAQAFDRPLEIVVIDNDPASRDCEYLIEQIPELRDGLFRYYVNSENIGAFGNWNRCIELARGSWVSILNDDDLLDTNYLALMFAELDRDPGVDGIACLKRFFGGANSGIASPDDAKHVAGERMSRRVLLGSLKSAGGRRSLAKRILTRTIAETAFRGRATRRIRPAKFFWGAVLGNSGGFLFRRSKAVEVGGFYPEEYPSSDIWFYARFAKIGHLRQHHVIAASIRQTEGNITVNTVTEQLAHGYKLYRTLAGSEAPRWWEWTIPLMIARDRAEYVRVWKTDIPPAAVEDALGIKLPRDQPRLHAVLRIVMGGT